MIDTADIRIEAYTAGRTFFRRAVHLPTGAEITGRDLLALDPQGYESFMQQKARALLLLEAKVATWPTA